MKHDPKTCDECRRVDRAWAEVNDALRGPDVPDQRNHARLASLLCTAGLLVMVLIAFAVNHR